MLRKSVFITIGLGLLLNLLGCSRARVTALEDQVAQLEAQNAAKQTEMESLQTRLEEAENTNHGLQGTLQAKEEMIARQEEALSDLQLQNQEIRANLEEIAEKKTAATKATALSGNFQADYDRALELFHKRWYIQAAALFKSLTESDREHKLADNCQYWRGECFYAQKQFEDAMAEFEKVFTYPNTNKADAAQMKIGLCWLEMKQYPQAREQLIRLLSSYPSSEYVPRARAILDQIP